MEKEVALNAVIDDTDVAELQRRIAELEIEMTRMRSRYDELLSLAYEDPLTRILNRRGLQREVERAIAFKRQHDTAITLLLFDLDDLKGVNDSHGHAAGDAVLMAMARTLVANTRPSDTVARLGGDEFATVLWNADAKCAKRRGHALVGALEATTIHFARTVLRVGASFGFSPIGVEDDFAGIYDNADRTLYRNKAKRRQLTR